MEKDYKRLREIGKGGMATVYLAKQVASNRLVAIKILRNESTSDREYVRRFFREARITAQLEHPNIVRVIESNYSEGLCYIVTEYIDGGDLRRLIPDCKIDLRRKLQVINKVINALDYAHQQGIVHRDIKPSNILLTRDMEPKLCDFGIATALWGKESRLTRTTESMGTMDYIAPEQKENSRDVDFRADIYSIGVILYETVTGQKPRGAFPSPKSLASSIPDRLDTCIMKCLQPWPYKRFKNTQNLFGELESILIQMDNRAPSPLPATAREIIRENTSRDVTVIKDDKQQVEPGFTEIIRLLKDGPLTQKLSLKSKLLEIVDTGHEDELMKLLVGSECVGVLKETVIEALGKIKSDKSCPYLIELLNDPYYNKAAANAIGEIGCKEAEYKLFSILISNSANSYIALQPLGMLQSVKSVREIAKYLKNPHSWIREMALDAMAKIAGSPDADNSKIIDYFEDVSRMDVNADIRARAKKILWRFEK
jgi:serine/threonine protein kinase